MSRALQQAHVQAVLAEYAPTTVSKRLAKRRAAVAALLRWRHAHPEVLLMKRAHREADRWSGHVSFPGGRAEPEDRDLLDTAVRETREEVGYDLSVGARVLGQLDDVMAVARGKVLPMAIRPYVFQETTPQPIELGDEAQTIFWLPLGQVASGQLDDTMVYRLGPVPIELPCWRFEGHVIWGLTYKMITRLVEVLHI